MIITPGMCGMIARPGLRWDARMHGVIILLGGHGLAMPVYGVIVSLTPALPYELLAEKPLVVKSRKTEHWLI